MSALRLAGPEGADAPGGAPGFWGELLRRLLLLPPQASTTAAEVDGLHYSVILTTMAGAALVTAVGLVFVIRYRRGNAKARRHGQATPPLWMEAAAVFGLLGLFVLWWVIGFRQYLRLLVPPPGALPVYVTAKQWMWTFNYPEGPDTNGVLYVPVGRPVRLIMTSRDVIHSFFVPEFRVKHDVVPGRYTSAWFEVRHPGVYKILCTEYCGLGHSTMRGQVIALSADDYERWLSGGERLLAGEDKVDPGGGREATALPIEPAGFTAEQEYAAPVAGELGVAQVSLVAAGERAAAEYGCLRCHTIDGTPHIGPTWAGLYRARIPLAGGGEVIADEAYLTESMMDPAAKLHAGFNPVMPSYQGLIGPGEVGALVEYMKRLAAVAPRGPAPLPDAQPPLEPPMLEGSGPPLNPPPGPRPSTPAERREAPRPGRSEGR